MPIALAVLTTLEAFFKFLVTPAGQNLCNDIRDGKVKLDQDMKIAGQSVQGWFKSLGA